MNLTKYFFFQHSATAVSSASTSKPSPIGTGGQSYGPIGSGFGAGAPFSSGGSAPNQQQSEWRRILFPDFVDVLMSLTFI